MTMRALVTIRGDAASVVRRALAPEAGRDVPRARVRISGTGETAEVLVDAEDTSSLRAALNSYLRWAQVAVDATEVARG